MGKVSRAGDSRTDGDCLEVLAAAGNIAGTTDSFHFVEQKAQGDFCIPCQIADWSATVPGEKVGVMIRESLDPRSPQVSVILRKVGTGSDVRLLSRTKASSSTTNSDFTRPDTWLRIVRQGDEFTGYSSLDGVIWSRLNDSPLTVPMHAEVFAGVASISGFQDYAVARICDLSLTVPCRKVAQRFRRGDTNADGKVDISDAVGILVYLFQGGQLNDCRSAADVNDDGQIDISDPVVLLAFLFQGGGTPPDPFAACGGDLTTDGLGCQSFLACP